MWIDVKKQLPEMKPGKFSEEFSEPVLVLTGEFGQDPCVAIARCWLSTQPGSEPKWYLDKLWSIAQVVTHWQPVPQIWKEGMNEHERD